ncbi:MAG: 30S ribosomal protein S12 methylthiotransferase RimO [Candidatus Omnitrophica bacterium]|nr:30S ribosomal protein S12 methylthiotransferase RimO [Candidatus Omnitrophota bacterium]MBU1047343.1 30S ribosomal protein S12 methylthiotransferase RimO [Candidatus Omnitrophota bacterium]MBU1630248.1 30S ribosomal protein S12 methylthiotransferase RimO [Candidatus Omnitrophota bacterium]MBU1767029.1 30S ribosomal protein S12 methylthiotransferase RimO [Candidatus Omnitrophota bacterium]MBU1889072.1 30S ribosomal protein S12 methylthiotransferase RimO [Candidatus Omnitrophota bacterium]
MNKIALVSLGCPKNLVDSEYMLGILLKQGFEIVSSSSKADIILINTCAFIESAQEESIDAILDIVENKNNKKICVSGCLVSLFKNELFKRIPEIDAIIDPFNIEKIATVCKKLIRGKTKIICTGENKKHKIKFRQRCFTGPVHSAYLKIADGCNNRCSYCIIPQLRGKYRSRRMKDIIEEAKVLALAGCKEINLVAQDTTLYGTDIYNANKLPELLEELSKIKKIRWIRLLYTHPAHYSDELINTIATNKKICKYLDMPLQHCSDKILKAMGRRVNKKDIVTLVNKLRKTIPDLTLRTTFLVGFPKETNKEFNELLAFTQDMQFDHVGVFTYSPQENTPSFNFKKRVHEKVSKSRREKLLSLQKNIAEKKNKLLKGKKVMVLIDKKINSRFSQGRREADAPDIDNIVNVKSKVKIGNFYKVKITKTSAYELEGEIIE